ncbi:MAG: hypothetical protein QM754_06340 [Tepidisphaeraceae bacterium]
MNNLQNDGWDFTDLKYIDASDADVANYRLNKGDILFNRTNSAELVGKCEVFREDGDWLYASYLIRVVVDKKLALPEFVSAFLNTPAGRLQIERISRRIAGMSNVNAEELRSLVLPLPENLDLQRKLTEELYAAKAKRDQLERDSQSLLTSTDQLLMEKLGINMVDASDRKAFCVRAGMMKSSQRFSAAYFHPERVLSIRAIEKAQTQGIRSARLDEIADFIQEKVPFKPGMKYLGLANVQSNTGELIETDDEPSGLCPTFKPGDVLMTRLRPYLNKVHLAEFKGICSPEFHVIRVKPQVSNDLNVHSEYLAMILRTSLILSQTRHMITGNTHPRLANEDVVGLVVPIPSLSVQSELVKVAKQRRDEARGLRKKAREHWEDAKVRFESRLLDLPGDER